jgi:hypothetical protein
MRPTVGGDNSLPDSAMPGPQPRGPYISHCPSLASSTQVPTSPPTRMKPLVFRHACKLGLEGIVSKRKGSPYRSGRSPDWPR